MTMSQPKQAVHDIFSAGLHAMLQAFLALLSEVSIDPANRSVIDGHVDIVHAAIASLETHVIADVVQAGVQAIGGQNGGQSIQGVALPTRETALTPAELAAFAMQLAG